MNAYYQKNNKTTLVTDTTFFPDVTVGDKLINFICAVVAVLTSTVAVKIEKAVLCTAVFFAFFGIIGSMDAGHIGLLSGLVLCGICSLIEATIFKSIIKRKKQHH